MLLKTGGTPRTEMVGKAMPRMPSNLAAKKERPGSWVASAKVWSWTQSPATWVKVPQLLGPGIFIFVVLLFGLCR